MRSFRGAGRARHAAPRPATTGTAGRSWASASVLVRRRLRLPPVHERDQLGVDVRIDARVLVGLEQLLPPAVRTRGGLLGAGRRPGREVLRDEQRRDVLPLAEVVHRVLRGEPEAAGTQLLQRLERELLLAETDPPLLHLELLEQLDVERELLERCGEAALEPARGME